MNTREKLIKARLGRLALAEELQNISLACKRAGISRSHFYEIKEAFEKYGAEGLAPRTRRRPHMPCHVAGESSSTLMVSVAGALVVWPPEVVALTPKLIGSTPSWFASPRWSSGAFRLKV